MHECQQDAMSYVRKYAHPDLFITTTANPYWPEIKIVCCLIKSSRHSGTRF